MKRFSTSELQYAIELIEKTINQNSTDPNLLCETGKFYFGLACYCQDHYADTYNVFDFDALAKKAVHYFSQAAHLNHALATHYLGHLYDGGFGVKQDFQQAIMHFERAIDLGYVFSMQRIGFYYEEGAAVKRDIEKAILYYQQVVKKGLISKEQRAVSLTSGLYKKAAPIKQAAAKNSMLFNFDNDAVAQLLLLATRETEYGLIAALTNLGFMHLENKHIPQDKVKAYEYLNEAAKLDCPVAQVALAKLFEQGAGVKQDDFRAAELYRKSAQQGHAPAQVRLGNFYMEGRGGIQKDVGLAKHYFELSALQGDVNAFVNLGYCYHHGIGTETDYQKALFFYQKAADLNHPTAFRNLSALYARGEGVTADRDIAKSFWERAEELSQN